jgi:hypothetical protein
MSTKLFWHGGPANLTDFLLPPVITGQEDDAGGDPVWCYVGNWTLAMLCALNRLDQHGHAAVYRVLPIGRLEPDECDVFGVAFRCRTARIISRRDIPPRIRRLWQADRQAVLKAYWESLEMGRRGDAKCFTAMAVPNREGLAFSTSSNSVSLPLRTLEFGYTWKKTSAKAFW